MDDIKEAIAEIVSVAVDDPEVRAYLAGFAACLRLRGAEHDGEVA